MFEKPSFVCFTKYNFPIAKFMIFITFQKRDTEAANGAVMWKKVIVKNFAISKKKTCVWVSF